jgi:hypothetical protein
LHHGLPGAPSPARPFILTALNLTNLVGCAPPYQPFVLDASYEVGTTIGNDTYAAPVPYSLLKGLTPTHEYLLSNDTRLAGVDFEYTRLVFEQMLQVRRYRDAPIGPPGPRMLTISRRARSLTEQANVVFYSLPNYPELYIALRNETCQVAITAAEMDPSRTLCTSSCPGPPFFLSGDYASGGYDDTTLAEVCCLEYGAPYLSQGFALLSLLQLAPFDVASALFNADVGNATLVILLMTASAGFLMHLIERGNPHLGSFSRSSYWSLMTFFLLADQTPLTKQGRFLQVVWLATNLVSMSVITSIISAKLTTSSLVVLKVETLADVTSGLCQETGYPVVRPAISSPTGFHRRLFHIPGVLSSGPELCGAQPEQAQHRGVRPNRRVRRHAHERHRAGRPLRRAHPQLVCVVLRAERHLRLRHPLCVAIAPTTVPLPAC